MAKPAAIAATMEAILRLLRDACPRDLFPAAEFQLYQPTNFNSPMTEGVSLYVYRIGVNAARRNLPVRIGVDGRRYLPPLPLDLYFLLTAWGRTASMQQQLLGWAIRTVEDTPLLPSSLLNDVVAETDVFQPNESAEVVFEPLTLHDLYNLWSVLRAGPQLSASYVVRAIGLDSNVLTGTGEPVQTRVLNHGQAVDR